MSGRASGTASAIKGCAPSITLDTHLKSCGVVNKAVDGSECHGRIGENLAPLAERLIGRTQQRAPCAPQSKGCSATARARFSTIGLQFSARHLAVRWLASHVAEGH